MGAYLSQPNTEKISVDRASGKLGFGASTMQGWRNSQEDDHNCELEFDDGAALFAVYDGHGGSEVSAYCSRYLPALLREQDSYGSDIGEALKECFLSMDQRLLGDDAKEELKKLASLEDNVDDVEDADEEEEISGLYADADKPLDQVLQRYNGNSEKHLSPSLRAKRDASGDSSSSAESTEFTPQAAESEAGGSSTKPSADGDAGNDTKSAGSDKPEAKGGDSPQAGGSAEAGGSGAGGSGNPQAGGSGSQQAGGSGSGPAAADSEEDTDDDDSDDSDEDLSFLEGQSEDDDDDDSDDDDDGFSLGPPPFGADREEPGFDSGTTAVVAVLRTNELVVANAGDSRAVLCRDGKAIDLSEDHKPDDELEKQRIEKAGGQVTADGRVSGGLNLSRAIGDHTYKQNSSLGPTEQMISPLPEIRRTDITDKDSFLVLACDGIWNSMTSQEVCDFISERIDHAKNLSSICEEMFMHCLAPDTSGDGTGCDNMTAIIVRLRNSPSVSDIPNGDITEKRKADGDDIESESKKTRLES